MNCSTIGTKSADNVSRDKQTFVLTPSQPTGWRRALDGIVAGRDFRKPACQNRPQAEADAGGQELPPTPYGATLAPSPACSLFARCQHGATALLSI
jgi:hypothetical protein